MTFRLGNHELLLLSDPPRKKIASFKTKLEFMIFSQGNLILLGYNREMGFFCKQNSSLVCMKEAE